MIEERIVQDLSPLGIPVFQQGDWTGGELPEEFATYYPVGAPDVLHYDNLPAMLEWQVQVNLYALDPARIGPLRSQASKALLSAGWTRQGAGNAGELDDSTGRFPWHMVFYKNEKEAI